VDYWNQALAAQGHVLFQRSQRSNNLSVPIRRSGISFEVADGRITGLLGPTARAKPHCALLYTLLKPDSGTAAVDGFDIAGNLGSAQRIGGAA